MREYYSEEVKHFPFDHNVVYSLFNSYRLHKFQPDQVPALLRREYATFLNVAKSFTAAATSDMPTLEIDKLDSDTFTKLYQGGFLNLIINQHNQNVTKYNTQNQNLMEKKVSKCCHYCTDADAKEVTPQLMMHNDKIEKIPNSDGVVGDSKYTLIFHDAGVDGNVESCGEKISDAKDDVGTKEK